MGAPEFVRPYFPDKVCDFFHKCRILPFYFVSYETLFEFGSTYQNHCFVTLYNFESSLRAIFYISIRAKAPLYFRLRQFLSEKGRFMAVTTASTSRKYPKRYPSRPGMAPSSSRGEPADGRRKNI